MYEKVSGTSIAEEDRVVALQRKLNSSIFPLLFQAEFDDFLACNKVAEVRFTGVTELPPALTRYAAAKLSRVEATSKVTSHRTGSHARRQNASSLNYYSAPSFQRDERNTHK